MNEQSIWARSIEADRELDRAMIALSIAEAVRDGLDRDRSASAAARSYAYGVVAKAQDDVREKLRISRELNARCDAENELIEAQIIADNGAAAVAVADAIIAAAQRR